MSEMSPATHPDVDEAALALECERLTKYLIDTSPSDRVRTAYVRAHRLGVVAPPTGVSRQDRTSLGWAERGGIWLKMADLNARFFQPGGYLRRKLVLLLALLETDTSGRTRADKPSGGGPVVLFFRLAAWGIVAAVLLVTSLAVLGASRPVKLPEGPGA